MRLHLWRSASNFLLPRLFQAVRRVSAQRLLQAIERIAVLTSDREEGAIHQRAKQLESAGGDQLGVCADHLCVLLLAALERAVAFGRFRARDVRSILVAGTGVARPTAPGETLVRALPTVPTRPLSDYAIGEGS